MTSRFTKPIFTLVAVAMAQLGQAQFSGQVSEYEFLPQRIYANPALRPSGKLNIGFPGLSNVYLEHNNNWFRPSQILQSDANGNATLDAPQILAGIDKAATTSAGFGLEILHVGLRIKKHYFHVRVAERAQFEISLPRDIFVLAVHGNVGHNEFENNTADFSDLAVNGIHFREYAVGYNYQWNDRLSVGLTAKYLYGMERVFTRESSLQLRTDPNTYALETSGAFLVNTAGIYGTFTEDAVGIHDDIPNYLFGLNNHGMAFDFGAVYEPIDKLKIQISAHDLGFIRWRSDVATYGTTDANFAFNGIDLTEFIFQTGVEYDDALDAEVQNLLDDLENVYQFERSTESFRTALNGFFRYGASYELYNTESFRGSVWTNLHHGIGQSVVPTRFAVGYNQSLWRVLQGGVHYSKQFGSQGFLGAGLSVQAGFFQLYCLVENLQFLQLTQINLIDPDNNEERTELIYPSNASDIRIQVGMNLVFGRKTDKRGAPMMR